MALSSFSGSGNNLSSPRNAPGSLSTNLSLFFSHHQHIKWQEIPESSHLSHPAVPGAVLILQSSEEDHALLLGA